MINNNSWRETEKETERIGGWRRSAGKKQSDWRPSDRRKKLKEKKRKLTGRNAKRQQNEKQEREKRTQIGKRGLQSEKRKRGKRKQIEKNASQNANARSESDSRSSC